MENVIEFVVTSVARPIGSFMYSKSPSRKSLVVERYLQDDIRDPASFIDPHPWTDQAVRQGKSIILVGRAEHVRPVHDLAVDAGFRPIVVLECTKRRLPSALETSNSRTSLAKRGSTIALDTINSTASFGVSGTRGFLQFGTPVYHSVGDIVTDIENGCVEIDIDSRGSPRRQVPGIRTQPGEHAGLNHMSCEQVIFVDPSVNEKEYALLSSREYWDHKQIEAARPLVSAAFSTMMLASFVMFCLMILSLNTHYRSTLVENHVLSSLIRWSGYFVGNVLYAFGIVRYAIFHCLGAVDQPIRRYVGIICIFPVAMLLGMLIFVDGYFLGDLLALGFHGSVAIPTAIFVLSRSVKRPLTSYVWMFACATYPVISWALVSLLMLAYLLLIPESAGFAAVFFALSFSLQEITLVGLLKVLYQHLVEAPREFDVKAVPGCESYGQGIPIAYALSSVHGMSELGRLVSLMLSAIGGASWQSGLIGIICCVVMNCFTRTLISSFLVGKLFSRIFSSPEVIGIAAPHAFSALYNDMRFAMGYVRFPMVCSIFVMRGFAYGNWTSEGDDSFVFNQTVVLMVLMSLVGEIIEDVMAHWLSQIRLPLKSVFGEYWMQLSSDSPNSQYLIANFIQPETGAPAPLLRGVRKMPLGLALGCLVPFTCLTIMLFTTGIGIESLAGPCKAVLDLANVADRVQERGNANVAFCSANFICFIIIHIFLS